MSHRHTPLAAFLLVLVAFCGCAAPRPTPAPPAATAIPSPRSTPGPTNTPRATATLWPPLSGSGGGMIAFVSNRSGNQDLWIMNADGSDQRQLTTDPAQDGWPRWSPDGKQMAFQSNRNGALNIYVADVLGGSQIDDGAPQQLTTGKPGRDSWEPAWSPDGKQLAFSAQQAAGSEIFLMNPDGTGRQRLTENRAIDGSPAWSPDGRQIAFFSSRDAVPAQGDAVPDQGGNWEIYVMDADGSHVLRLTDQPGQDHSPAWSPDGARIAFVSERDGNEEIYLMNPDGTSLQRLTHNEAEDWYPAWSPDGKRIAFSSSRDAAVLGQGGAVSDQGGAVPDPGGSQEIYVMNADGSNPQRLTNNQAEDWGPAWRPSIPAGG